MHPCICSTPGSRTIGASSFLASPLPAQMASRLNFRPRQLDKDRPMAIVRDLSQLDSTDAPASRDVAHNHQALDKVNEAVKTVKTKKGKEIPVPEVRNVASYAVDYLPIFRPPQTYIHGRGTRIGESNILHSAAVWCTSLCILCLQCCASLHADTRPLKRTRQPCASLCSTTLHKLSTTDCTPFAALACRWSGVQRRDICGIRPGQGRRGLAAWLQCRAAPHLPRQI